MALTLQAGGISPPPPAQSSETLLAFLFILLSPVQAASISVYKMAALISALIASVFQQRERIKEQ